MVGLAPVQRSVIVRGEVPLLTVHAGVAAEAGASVADAIWPLTALARSTQ